jgi:hypothetical protein
MSDTRVVLPVRRFQLIGGGGDGGGDEASLYKRALLQRVRLQFCSPLTGAGACAPRLMRACHVCVRPLSAQQ